MCWEYIDITASNIPQTKFIAVSQRTFRFNIQRKPEKCWCLLKNLPFGLFDHKKIPRLFQNFSKIQGLSRILFKFQDFPGLVGTMFTVTPDKTNTLCYGERGREEERLVLNTANLKFHIIINNFVFQTKIGTLIIILTSVLRMLFSYFQAWFCTSLFLGHNLFFLSLNTFLINFPVNNCVCTTQKNEVFH